jgi:hypothetical protein
MAYHVFWQIPQEVLCLELTGDATITDFTQINEAILHYLGDDSTEQRVVLLIDATQSGRVPAAFAQLKASQTYTQRYDLKMIAVASTDKFIRLMMMLTFNLCKPGLRFFNSVDHALEFAQRVSYER